MRVNDQLENAAIEVVDSLPSTVAVGRMLFLSTNSKMYVGNASKKPVVIGHSVGEIKTSMLTLSQFQAEFDDTWVLANGASAAGTDYGTITSESTIPDLRGRFLRGKNNGRTDSDKDPNGDLALGSAYAHRTGNSRSGIGTANTSIPHTHSYSKGSGLVASYDPSNGAFAGGDNKYAITSSTETTGTSSSTSHSHTITGLDNETAPAYTVVNYFIKVNR